MMNSLFQFDRFFPYAIPPILSFLTCFTLATICFLKGRRHTDTIMFGMICVLWGVLNLDKTLQTLVTDGQLALKIARIDHFFLVLQLGIYAHFMHHFIHFPKKAVYVFYAISILLMPITQTNWYYQGVFQFYWGYSAHKNFGFTIFGMITMILILWGCFNLFKAAKKETNPAQRSQYNYFLIGGMLTPLLNLANTPSLSGYPIYPPGNFTFIPILIMAYGVFRHDLVKINQYTKRRIFDVVVKITVAVGFSALIIVCVWAVEGFRWDFILSRIVPYGIPPLMTFVCSLFLSILALRVGQAHKEALIFALMSLLWGFLNMDILLNGIIVDPIVGLQLNRWDHFFFVFVPALSLHLTYLVIRRHTMWWVVYFFYFIGIILAPITQTKYYFYDMHAYYWGFFAKGGIFFDIFGFYCIIATIYSVYLLVEAYIKESNSFQKHRIFYLASGFAGYAILTLGDIPAVKGIELYPPGNFAFITLLLFAYGLFKQNLKEVVQITRSMLFWIGLGLMLFAMAAVFKYIFPTEWSLSVYLLGIVSILICYKLARLSWNNALSLFFGQQRERLDQILDSLIEDLLKPQKIQSIYQTLKETIFKELLTFRFAMLIESNPSKTNMGISQDQHLSFHGWESWNPAKSLFANTDLPDPIEQSIAVASDHPILPMFSKIRTLTSQEQIEEWILSRNISVETTDRLLQAVLIQPVFFEKRLKALLILGSKIDSTVYTEDENVFLRRLSMALGPHIKNAELLQGLESLVEQRTQELQASLADTKEKEQEIAHINQVVQTVNSTLDFDEVAGSVKEALKGIFEFDAMAILLINETQQQFVIHMAYGDVIQDDHVAQYKKIKIPLIAKDSVNTYVIAKNKPFYFTDLNSDTEMLAADRRIWEILPFMSGLFLPLEVQNEVIGAINFFRISKNLLLTEEGITRIQQYVFHLATAINNARMAEEIMTAKKKVEAVNKELEKLANLDGLTQIANRRYFNDYLDKEWHRLAREKGSLALILCDIDHFKNYNDTYGHLAGDDCLKKVVQGISNCLKRPADLLARYGGEEFVIVLPHTDLWGALSVAETIQLEMAKLKITHEQSTASQYVSLSIGVSCTIPVQERSSQNLINAADQSLYHAKESGRNQIKSKQLEG